MMQILEIFQRYEVPESKCIENSNTLSGKLDNYYKVMGIKTK